MNTASLEKIQEVISVMDTITLEEMSHVHLMHRRDTKYVVPLNELPDILEKVSGNYKALDIKGELMHDYETLYFDTNEYAMYYAHHDQHKSRYKIRMREYMLSGDRFLEVKFKNEADETIKTRIPISDFSYDSDCVKSDFLKCNSPFSLEQIEPMLKNKFARMTFVSNHRPERLTIDIDLNFTNHSTQQNRHIGQIAIIEVKRDVLGGESDMVDALSQLNHDAQGFSKYCIGTAIINNKVKTNLIQDHIDRLDIL